MGIQRTRLDALVLAGALLLGGCSTYGITGALPAVEEGNSAKVVVIRPAQRMAVSVVGSYPVLIDGIKIYKIGSGQHVSIPVTAGRRIIAVRCLGAIVTKTDVTVPITLVRDEAVYFKLEPSNWTCPDVTQIQSDEAKDLMRDTTAITGVGDEGRPWRTCRPIRLAGAEGEVRTSG
jgi:hypothetical protein